jgi:CRISPR-associated protein Csb2
MPLTITVRLRHGRYDAGVRRGAEWPPQPARVFCALVASARAESDWAALRWLEAQPPPQVLADSAENVHYGRVVSYVVENATSPKGGSQEWIGRRNGMRARAHVIPATDSFAITWPDAGPPPEILASLATLAWMVPYVGRSTSMAEVTATGSNAVQQPGWVTYEPTQLDDPLGRWQLAVPHPGYTGTLADAYQDGRRAWEVARSVAYRVTPAAVGPQAESVAGPFSDLLVWRLATPDRGLDGGQATLLTQALRSAVMGLVPDPLPPQLTGHGADDDTHLAYLVVPDVGHDHADGHVLGLAIAVPRTYPERDQDILLRSLIRRMTTISLPGVGKISLCYGPGRTAGLRSATWVGAEGGARTWVTATPMRANGWLRRGRTIGQLVSQALVRSGYPEPINVATSGAPMLRGAVWRARPCTLPGNYRPFPFTHARVTFAEPVTGPVIAGSLRYLGLGLFLPLPDDDQEQPQSPRERAAS